MRVRTGRIFRNLATHDGGNQARGSEASNSQPRVTFSHDACTRWVERRPVDGQAW
jgi:hypothetical protein